MTRADGLAGWAHGQAAVERHLTGLPSDRPARQSASYSRSAGGAWDRIGGRRRADEYHAAGSFARSLVVKVNAGQDLDGDDCRDGPVDHETERRPPPCWQQTDGDAAERSLSPWPARPTTSSHGEPVTAAAAMMMNMPATPLSTARTVRRPSATAKPM